MSNVLRPRGLDPKVSVASVGRQIHTLRTRAGISQAALAERAGMSTRALRDIENGRVRRPQSRTIKRLASALGLTNAVVNEIHAEAQRESGGLRYLILGNLSIQRDDETIVIARPMVRRLLALLILRYPEPVTPGELVEVLWTPEPPKSWQSLIHTYTSQIRQLLGADDEAPVVRKVPSGYLLNADRGQSDLSRFDELAAQAQRSRDAGLLETAMDELAAALRCWRDQILADADSSLRLHPAAIAAGERRIKAALSYADLALPLRRPEQAVPILWDLTTAEPLHEGLHARLILTLASCGEQAAALNVFQKFRERLDEQLGITPSEEIRDAYMRVLRQQLPVGPPAGDRPADRPVPARPAQLPAAPAGYVGRGRQSRELDEALSPGRSAGAQAIVVVGAPGSGKTALAVHWAHARREVFPDGQLFVNLRGYSMQPPLSSVDVLGQFLRALGTPPAQVPSIEEEAAALFRTLVASKRLLIVLDNARSVAQVRPLLPGGESCRVIITSRISLAGLVVRDGARYLALDELQQGEAEALVRQALGPGRAAAEPEAVASLVRLCGMLPLALRVAAANLIAHPAVSIAHYCAQLAGGNLLNGLHIEGDDRSIRSTFDLSYHALDDAVQRMFRLLSLMPGGDITVEGAAALADSEPATAARMLRTLTDSHIVQESAPGRFSLHDLLRSYARELADEAESHDGRLRLLDWYAAGAEAAARVLYPGELSEETASPAALDTAPASTWLERERENLVNATMVAEQAGFHRAAWRLARALHRFLYRGMYIADTLPVAAAGLSAATADGDLRAMSAAQLCLAECHWARGANVQARDLYAAALATAQEAGWCDGQAMALRRIAAAHQENGDMREASDLLSRARSLTVDRHGTAAAEDSLNLGLICWKMGRLAEAVTHHGQAADCFAALGSDSGEAIARTNIGIAYRALGRPHDAIQILTEVLPVHVRTGNRSSEIVALSCLSGAYSDVGDHSAGLRIAQEALRGVAEMHDRRLAANALFALAVAKAGAAELDGAAADYLGALNHAGVVHDRLPQAAALIGLATVQMRRGEASEALATADMAVKLAGQAELPVLEGNAMNVVAGVRVGLGQPRLALTAATDALVLHRRTGHRPGEARSHLALGAALTALGRRAEAFAHLRSSLLLYREMGMPAFRY